LLASFIQTLVVPIAGKRVVIPSGIAAMIPGRWPPPASTSGTSAPVHWRRIVRATVSTTTG
jgi:hypothetical protein